jgi:hypothetical protein
MNHEIRGWNECLITYVLAASAPRYPIHPDVYHRGWAEGRSFRNAREFYGITLPLGPDYGGPLFFAHYSFLGLDPRGLSDRYADYFQQNVAQDQPRQDTPVVALIQVEHLLEAIPHRFLMDVLRTHLDDSVPKLLVFQLAMVDDMRAGDASQSSEGSNSLDRIFESHATFPLTYRSWRSICTRCAAEYHN